MKLLKYDEQTKKVEDIKITFKEFEMDKTAVYIYNYLGYSKSDIMCQLHLSGYTVSKLLKELH
ncbi:MAG: hypothetical protein KAX49_12925 [Halanaerobiales bacterium]|nr:hypothetical protein [Halanaerobiales bacterium]